MSSLDHHRAQELEHGRGSEDGRVLLEYGDYECPYSRLAYREIERVERWLQGDLRFAFRHFPLRDIHPHAQAAAQAAEAAALQGRFWEMHDLLFAHQHALGHDDLAGYASELDLDLNQFERDFGSQQVSDRIGRDIDLGVASGEVAGTPTLFIDGVVHRGSHDAAQFAGGLKAMTATCTHLDAIELTEVPAPVAGCEDCIAIGGRWVHLRMCQSCGHVGCCDSSQHRHASAHARRTSHPVVRSAEPGEDWSYCYVDELFFVFSPD